MEIDEDHVQYLLSMGFPSELDVRKALRAAKNDVNDAVAILTNDHPVTSFDALDDIDIEMKDIHPKNTQGPVYGPALPPSYDEVVESEQKVDEVMLENPGVGEGHGEDENPYEFPVTNLYELEGRVFAEHWSIPYKREESLGKCLVAATRLAEAGLSDGDENCTRFVDRCMQEAFQKLMTASAVHKWNTEIQEGIFSMLQLLIDLVVARLQHLPVHIVLMDVLAMWLLETAKSFIKAFNPETEYHYKNKTREDRTAWEDKFEGGQPFAVGPTSIYNKHPYGWLTHLINRFAIKGGFNHLKKTLENDDLDAPSIAALLRPFGTCAEFLNADLVRVMLSQGMEKSIKFVQNLEEKDFKEKKVGSVSDLMASMKLLCIHMWPTDIKALDDLRLDIALRMLKSPHFNAKMNSLKEVTKLIEDATSSKFPRVKTAIGSEKILDWMVKNKVLSIALEGNIDQAQYCDKIKGIVDFLGTELSLDELSMIWKLQNGQTNNVIENIHSIIAAAAVKFDPSQLEHLVLLIQKNWQEDNDKMREKLLSLIGKIGRDSKVPKTTSQVLNLLWDLAHLPVLSTDLIEQALDEHLGILNDSYAVKDQVKRQYVSKCVEDIKKGACVLPTLKQLHQLSKNILKHSFKQDKGILHDLNKNCDIIKLVTQSLVKCHKQAITVVGETGTFGPDTLVDTRYPHSEYVNQHLSFLQYVLQEGVLYLPWNRAKEIWSTLVASTEACEWDRETCYEWFSSGIMDLDNETQSQLFLKELLRLDSSKLSEKGFQCFKTYFETVNRNDHRLKKDANGLMVAEKSELLGLDFLWELCLNTQDESIANNAIQLLLSMSYTSLASRLKKDPLSLHKKFITECKTRLEAAMLGVVGTVVARAISSATKTLTASIVPEVANIPPPTKSQKQLNIERLLWIADQYVLSVEETHTSPRTILPHGASFQGYQINLFVTSETPKQEFMLVCHSNETLGGVRVKISYRLRQTPENIQIVAHEKLLGPSKDQKLLHQLDFEDNQMVQVRLVSSSTSSTPSKEPMSTPSSKQTFDLEQEKTLPGVVMAAGGEVFDMLYQLADLEEPKITTRVRKLLMLIPTDPAISEALDSITSRGLKDSSSTEDLSPRASPRKITPSPSPPQSPQEVLSNLFDASAPDMSAFRVLYNMEVLSSKLVPTSQDTVTRSSTQTFFEEFLNAGGLSVVVNVLQPEALHQDTIYETRQGCYSICLQLARFLLCGQTVTGDVTYASSITEEPKTPFSASAPAAGATPHSVPSISITDSWAAENRKAGRHAVETMGVHDFTETVSCFMRVAWAAAAGKLHLLSFAQPIRENTVVYSCGKRSRQSSTGSTASTGSESDTQSLHGGVCVQQQVISTKDCNIAKEALEILVTCLQLRSELIATFYSLPCVSDFIIDILVGCSQADIRNAALDQFYLLSQTEVSLMEGAGTHQQNPHQFLLQVLLKAYLPFWVSSTSTRGASQRLLNHCSQYFDLRCKLLEKLSVIDQRHLQVDVHSMLEDEINWLTNFVPSTHQELKETDNCLLAGHLKLIRTLFTCENVNKEEFGKMLVYDLLHDFLFPASKLMMDSLNGGNLDNLSEFNPKCNSTESRVAAYELLTELAFGSVTNLSDICKQLLQMHHLPNPDSANEWEYLPPVDGRASCGYVGLKNGGATCYMNSVIQQLYMMPNIPESILCIDEEENNDEEHVFYQLQTIFGHLMDSHLQYYEPEKFWRVFQLWGQIVNIREQQDAFDFFQALVDQMDEHMKNKGKEELFKKMFQGVFSDQKICKECPHRYEREEAFLALNLTVKNATLQDSLDQFVKGELLEGDNAYYCEKCEEKRNTIKRMCIKTIPPHLCIQLKRFGYDWEANRALKFDDYFKFPWILDMEPYTAEGMARCESANMNGTMEQDLSSEDEQAKDVGGNAGTAGDSKPPDIVISSYPDHKPINYELVGIVVHSGQANAGHYYSFIKDRRGTVLNNPNKGKWFRFNDTIVEEFEMNDTSLESECFGGTYKAKVYDQSNSYPEERQRYWNGYMLYYERMEESKTPLSTKKSKLITKKLPANGRSRLDSDSLMELTELVHKGERRGIFMEKMPASIQRLIHAENLTFVKNRDVYNQEYFKFVKNHVARNSLEMVKVLNRKDSLHLKEMEKNQVTCPQYSEMSVWSIQLGIKFLFNTYFRTKIKTRPELDEWVEVIETILTHCKEACLWLLEYLASEEGSGFIRPFLLDCPNRDVRLTMAKILERLFCCFLTTHSGLPIHKSLDTILENLLLLLNKEVIDQCKQSIQYFLVLKSYVQLGTKACIHMFKLNGFKRLAVFLLGNFARDQEANIRRWSSIQSRDFANLHTTLATLLLNCDVSSFRTEDVGSYPVKKPQMVIPQTYLKMSTDMENYVFGAESVRYLREVVHAIRETGNPLPAICDMLLYCSFCNEAFSTTLIKQLMLQYMNSPSNELKPIFSILTDLLTLEDSLQLKRLQLIIDGHVDDNGQQFEGLLAVVRLNHVQDSKRSYGCIKFLVNLANKCPVVKDYLQQTKSKWQWAVNWLKKKMSEYSYWSSSSTTTLSNEDSSRKSFQRTVSAQDTLAEATAILSELEAVNAEMDTNSNPDSGSERVEESPKEHGQLDEDGQGQDSSPGPPEDGQSNQEERDPQKMENS